MPCIVRINARNGSVSTDPLPPQDLLLGGRGLTSRMLLQELSFACHPFSRDNKAVFAGGPLAGTDLAGANRLSAACKNPLDGSVKEGNVGGTIAHKLGRLGIRAVVIEDAPEENLGGPTAWRLLVIDAAGARLEDAPPQFASQGVYAKSRDISARFGNGAGAVLTGPAAGQRLPCAGIIATGAAGSPVRFSGRGGLGAVLASKSIAAIVVNDTGAAPEHMADPQAFAAGLATANALVSCVRGCAARCSNINAEAGGEAAAFANAGTFATDCGISDPAASRLVSLCNDMGLDAFAAGSALGMAMRAGLAPLGDAAFAEQAISGIARGDILSKLIGCGAEIAARVLGQRWQPGRAKTDGGKSGTKPKNTRKTSALHDLLGLCVMLGPAISGKTLVVDMVNARYGTSYTMDDAETLAEETLMADQACSSLAGLRPA